jgi:ubiquinone/menaquinone biosynthesis C-methylase UbiE
MWLLTLPVGLVLDSGGNGDGFFAAFAIMSFDALAPHYRWMEFVLAGNKLQRDRTAFLSQVGHRQNALLVGEGNGRFLLECRRSLQHARVTCMDASDRMLALARERAQNSGLGSPQIQFIHADALDWTPPVGAFDLVVTHYVLDCFRPDQLKQVVATLAKAAAPDATWLLADFQVPATGLRRCRALIIHRLMYLFFRLATRLPARHLTGPDSFLEEHGFTLRDRRLSEWGLLHSDRWERVPPA